MFLGDYASGDMERLRNVVAFWRDCVTAEGALEQSFSVTSGFRLGLRTRARFFTGSYDPFIFAEAPGPVVLEKGGLYDFVARASLKGQDMYFGYPMLMFYDKALGQHRIAPLFVIRLKAESRGEELVLIRAEPTPTLGSKAFEKLGLRQDEIVTLNAEVSKVFDGTTKAKLETILYLLRRETSMTFVEGINPDHLGVAQTIHPYSGTVIYNRAVLYASEASAYNLHLLNDLERLVKKRDLSQTALGYLKGAHEARTAMKTPVLPFAFDEYQLAAIEHIMGSSRTVVTGPPGTGKSQFIANLIVNLFLQKKRVLFVSHTTEAVRVVNERINEQFSNLMMQTGKKEVRQDLGRKLADMVSQYNDQRAAHTMPVTKDALSRNWRLLQREVAYLRATDRLHARLTGLLAWEGRLESWPGYRRAYHWLGGWRTGLLMNQIRKRRDLVEVARRVDELKQRHIELSREYVRANYVSMIFEGEQYGKLVAYIEAVQSRRPSQQGSDPSDRYITAALQAMSIWSCTLKSLAATFPLTPALFDYVIFDEASQIDLPSAAPALYRAARMVVVGDEKQLLHIAKISETTEEELARSNQVYDDPRYPGLIGYREASLFNSAKRSLSEPEQQLKNHYRSSPAIAAMFSHIFYGGKLRLRTQSRQIPDGIPGGVVWHDVKGRAYKHKSGSRYNPDEVARIVEELHTLLPLARAHHLNIGITTPYALQQDYITRSLEKAYSPEELSSVRVLTVHRFQGSEVDILFFSTVLAANGDGGSDYWYAKNEQILNVAVSRARQALIIVGDREHALSGDSKLKAIAQYCLDSNAVGVQATMRRPMNRFEHRLLALLIPIVPKSYRLESQYVHDGRYTLDFALLSKRRQIAIALDGGQHEIIGGLPVFEDRERDTYLANQGWEVIHIPVYRLLSSPEAVREEVVTTLRQKSSTATYHLR